MKKIAAAMLVILLCVSAVGCVESQRVQTAFQDSDAGKMIGKTFQEVETAFGPFSMVYLEEDWSPLYLFTGTNVGFYFGGVETPASWSTMFRNGTSFIPAAVALQTIRSTDVCTGVMGRISDFGIPAADVSALSQYLGVFQLSSYDTADNTVYTVTTADQTLDVYVFAQKGSRAIAPEDSIRVLQAGTRDMKTVSGGSRRLPQYNGADVTSVDTVHLGSLVTFGVYEQDNDLKNGAEPISWRVLKKSGKRMLLITDRIIDVRAFHDTYEPARWRASSIRTWLNGTFLTSAFTEAEQTLIPEVVLADIGNENWYISTGTETRDRIFLLNSDEAYALLSTKADRVAQPTDYALARGFTGNPDGWWWLRNPGQNVSHAVVVDKSGNVFMEGDRVSREYYGVRPAIWVEIP